jgi:hypothetical protein
VATYLLAMAVIFGLVVGGIAVDRLYRRFAAHNPQLGPFRPPGKQDCCNCTAGSGCADAATCASPEAASVTLHRQ